MNPILQTAAILGAAMIGASPVTAASIAWNFTGGDGAGNLNPTESAGAPGFSQSNWNNHQGNGQGPGNLPLTDLVDSTGTTTTVDVTSWTQSANNSWYHGETDTPDEKLTNNFSNQGTSITFAQIPYSIYDVVVYYGHNESISTGDLSVGGLTRQISGGGSTAFYTAGYLEGTELNGTEETNYTVFPNVSGPSATVSFSQTAGNTNLGISAIQFVQVIPEPGSAALLALAGLPVLFRRKRLFTKS